MILLQSKDVFEDMLRMDPLNGRTWWLKRSSSPELLEAPINGTFSNIGGQRLMLYRLGGLLRFEVEGKLVEIDDQVKSTIETQDGKRIFKLIKEGKELLQFEYNAKDLEQGILGDMTPYIGEEDFDFCQFVHNVLSDKRRRGFIYSA